MMMMLVATSRLASSRFMFIHVRQDGIPAP